ncbi:MAG: M1 family aminopeptidase [Gemmatimonadaceae bacterium]
MSWRRFRVVAADEFRLTLRRPMVWVLLALVIFLSYGLSVGWVQVALSTGDATVGGKKAFLTSEFALTQVISVFSWSAYLFFVAAAAGLAIIRDDEARVLELLHSTPLRPAEYAWGKFVGVLGAFVAVLGANILFLMLCLAVLPNAEMLETRGPFSLWNYAKPALLFGIPTLAFNAAIAFAVGTGTRKAILVFALPVALLLFCGFFLWSWSPAWLSEPVNRVLMFVDPSGLRWLRETYLVVDRGVEFYNTATVELDALIIWSRLVWTGLGLGLVALSIARYARQVRASHPLPAPVVELALRAAATPSAFSAASAAVAPRTATTTRLPSRWDTLLMIARAESRELASQPGLYLFVPLLLIQVIGGALVSIGAFDTPLLRTPGQLAATQMELLTAYVTLLLMFYAVESLERERSTRLNAIHDTLPVGTGTLLGGKALALGVVIGVIVLACLAASAILVLLQGKVAFSLTPFALLWVLLLLPTFFIVIAFVFAAYGLSKGRYGAYGITLGAIALSVWAGLSNRENWVTDWALTSAVRWSDMSVLEFDRNALVLNRLFWLAVAIGLWRLAVWLYPRVDRDAVRFLHASAPRRLLRGLRPAIPFLVAPVVLGGLTYRQVTKGPDGGRAEKAGKDYWRKNLATWQDAAVPWLKDVHLDVRLEPRDRAWFVRGSYLLVNHRDTTLRHIPLTVGHWRSMRFAVDGDSIRPDTASHLYVFSLRRPVGPGDSVRLAFSYEGRHEGASRSGGGAGEFLLPSGAVMQGWSPQYFPTVGYEPDIGVDDDNRYESRDYPDDYWMGETRPLFGSQRPMTVTTRIDVPESFIANGVGERLREEVKRGRRISEWRTDEPVMAYNIVAGRWQVRRGEGTALYYHADHTYNVDEMIEAMDAARKWYGEWFGAFPWKELKISEFPALATYAQGFPTNITFSEDIGFLTRSEPKTNLALLVTAHEIAHQWWGNMLQPGAGPGGNLLSEGMAHFSTILLIGEHRGARNAMEFRERIETRYGDNRFADAERKLYRIDGSKNGDGTVMYDKGGWVFWMLTDLMGREPALRGMREFIRRFRGTDDHALLQDFTSHMRAYATDTAAYDGFVRQWFDSVVVLEYKVDSAVTRKRPDGKWETRAIVRNAGTGAMPVDVAVTRGERFPADTLKVKPSDYRQAVTRLTLSPGMRGDVITIASDFEPHKVVVDPDVRVLQLRRPSAERKVTK